MLASYIVNIGMQRGSHGTGDPVTRPISIVFLHEGIDIHPHWQWAPRQRQSISLVPRMVGMASFDRIVNTPRRRAVITFTSVRPRLFKLDFLSHNIWKTNNTCYRRPFLPLRPPCQHCPPLERIDGHNRHLYSLPLSKGRFKGLAGMEIPKDWRRIPQRHSG